MDVSTSDQYGSGCASGWTMYLDPFSSSTTQWDTSMPFDNGCHTKKGAFEREEDEEEDEDLSMLSDASSGPPHFHQDEHSTEETVTVSEPKRSKHRKKAKEHRRKQQNFHLDDTASSPVLSFSKAPQRALFFENNAVVHNNDKYFMVHDSSLSQGFSATHCKGKSVLKKHFGFLKSSITGKAD